MQVVIDIPKDVYTRLFDNGIQDNEIEVDDVCEMARAIRLGTPLPKGHGRVVDADELKKVYNERLTYLYKLNKKENPSREPKICATNWCNNTIDELPTIIEADRSEDYD